MRFKQQCTTLSPTTKKQLIALFSALEYGEELAQYCAHKQAQLVQDSQYRKFLRLQSRQEAFHAKFFRQAIRLIDKNASRSIPYALRQFHNKLENALKRQDLTETLVGQQIVLESFGGAVLYHLNRGLDNYGIGLHKLRNMILNQELKHNDFGETLLHNQLASGRTSFDKIQSLSGEYLELADMILHEMSDVFLTLKEDPDDYRNHIHSNLPEWQIS